MKKQPSLWTFCSTASGANSVEKQSNPRIMPQEVTYMSLRNSRTWFEPIPAQASPLSQDTRVIGKFWDLVTELALIFHPGFVRTQIFPIIINRSCHISGHWCIFILPKISFSLSGPCDHLEFGFYSIQWFFFFLDSVSFWRSHYFWDSIFYLN